MTIFTDALEAVLHALDGHQALHVWCPEHDWPTAPAVFKKYKEWAHFFDQDVERLKKTARQLGVRVIFVHHEGTKRQHIDLCGKPLERAKKL